MAGSEPALEVLISGATKGRAPLPAFDGVVTGELLDGRRGAGPAAGDFGFTTGKEDASTAERWTAAEEAFGDAEMARAAPRKAGVCSTCALDALAVGGTPISGRDVPSSASFSAARFFLSIKDPAD